MPTNFRILSVIISALLFLLPCARGEETQPKPSPPLSVAGLRALEHASKLVAVINKLDWKTAEALVPPGDPWLQILKRDAAALKNWPGIGAFRASDFDSTTGDLRHRFIYGYDRTAVHEVWCTYKITGDDFEFRGMCILGW